MSTAPVRVHYDTEFVDTGREIELISIGMVNETTGAELYAVNADLRIGQVFTVPWLVDNVLPHLPRREHKAGVTCRSLHCWHLDTEHPDVRPKAQIARMVEAFLTDARALAGRRPRLWAWYGAYDHVCLAQLWGPMADKPEVMPMWTNDLRQRSDALGNPELPKQPVDGAHNALADARHNVVRARFLDEVEARLGRPA